MFTRFPVLVLKTVILLKKKMIKNSKSENIALIRTRTANRYLVYVLFLHINVLTTCVNASRCYNKNKLYYLLQKIRIHLRRFSILIQSFKIIIIQQVINFFCIGITLKHRLC